MPKAWKPRGSFGASSKSAGLTITVTNQTITGTNYNIESGDVVFFVVTSDSYSTITPTPSFSSLHANLTTPTLVRTGRAAGATATAGAGVWMWMYSCKATGTVFSNATMFVVQVGISTTTAKAVAGWFFDRNSVKQDAPWYSNDQINGTSSVRTPGVAFLCAVAEDATTHTITEPSGNAPVTASVGTTGGNAQTNIQAIIAWEDISDDGGYNASLSPASGGDSAAQSAVYDINMPAVTQAAWRVYQDGTEAASTALAAQDTAPTIEVYFDSVIQLRLRLQETAVSSLMYLEDWALQYEKNADGNWIGISSGSGIIDGYPATNQDSEHFVYSTAQPEAGQSFKGNGTKLTRVGFLLKKTGSPNGTVTAKLYAHSGTYGTTGVPTGTALATSTTTINNSSISTSYQWVYFDFDGTYTLTAGTPYFIVLVTTNTNSNNGVFGIDLTSSTHPGNRAIFASGVWNVSNGDMCFEVYGLADTPAVAPQTSVDLQPATHTQELSVSGTSSVFAAGRAGASAFIAPHTGPLLKAALYIGKNSTPTAGSTLRAALWETTDGVIPNTAATAPVAWSTNSVDINSLLGSATGTRTEFTFDGTYQLQEGVTYFIGAYSSDQLANSPNGWTFGNSAIVENQGSAIFQSGAWTGGVNVTTYRYEIIGDDGGATTNRLGAGTGTFDPGKYSQKGKVGDLAWTAGDYTEVMYSLKLLGSGLSNGDAIRFRVLFNNGITSMTYTATPLVNVTKTPPAVLTNQRVGVPVK